MNPEYKIKGLLQEADLPEDDQSKRLISLLLTQPDVMPRHEPPAGYEDRLMAALKTRIALERPRVADSRASNNKFFGNILGQLADLLRMPQTSWSVAAGLAVLIAFFALSGRGVAPSIQNEHRDMLANTAVKGGEHMVDEWIESVGDSGIRMARGERDLASIVHNIDAMGDSAAVDKALTEVATAVGYASKN